MGNRYPDPAGTLLQALPKDQQTKEVFAQRLLESEKNETINQEINSLTLGTSSSASVNATTRNPGHSSAGPSTLKVCGYVRKRQGRHSWNKPGQVCVKKHTGSAG